ncbi:universal stress protein [Verminephrobacter aporrectodeae subsp. tuberculatae]|uniref:Universal stress protein n=1 Tax=Verminephrobacter aporrectodeae subsp. tuberculatae TaxID=1110392 RepID=A0ABT3KVD1_9BURK|nr:universal stress protein [Verminephrobacter aporrectodeae]MCW5223143.1 universal stress protein [Verminephrobacter aporrectodeae subsp. tuberculatae]MCW5288607.1 universal stress protein [Verminephrobacter aporrectodeae subsp. tuberculatae]MCW5322196.1 universal stress protein [Verminephrobacter aporrectodeae subsp. tuberculatae]MCW8164478.1 universal stress protein [Verminephrobacter aporrectodeae subsp. tuberculatae]MCW8168754.1 universal stress protein [Verminephrobacter aporrectodeae su
MLKILIAVDGSELSLDGVRHALTLIRQGLAATVVLAHVQEPATLYEMVTVRDPELIAAASLEAGEHLMARARALLEAAGVPCETAVGVGDVAHTLVDMIERSGCDLVIIGARGQGAISSALLGSVSQEVAHASPAPVTIVKHAEAPEAAAADNAAEDAEDTGV